VSELSGRFFKKLKNFLNFLFFLILILELKIHSIFYITMITGHPISSLGFQYFEFGFPISNFPISSLDFQIFCNILLSNLHLGFRYFILFHFIISYYYLSINSFGLLFATQHNEQVHSRTNKVEHCDLV
jgi:hypothetical protein